MVYRFVLRYSESMGFYDFMRRMVEGQPVFQDDDSSINNEAPHEPQPQPGVAKNGILKGRQETFPFVEVAHLKPHVDGQRLTVYGHIKNEWHDEILLDKIIIFGVKRELDTFLRAHEERDFLLYDGPLIRHEEHEAHIDYKTRNEGDYFRSVFRVKYAYNANNQTYTVSEMHLHRPVLDIYE